VAGVPERVGFATKPRLGRALLAHAFAAGVRCAWVTVDGVYGANYGLRRFIERHGRGYVLAVTSAQRLALKPVTDWLEDVRPGLGEACPPVTAATGRGFTTGPICPTARMPPRAGRRVC
jgi:hypothetical protein